MAMTKIMSEVEQQLFSAPMYSICMVNYNMARTLDASVRSIATQLDEAYEIVLVDDGSTDGSVTEMHRLAAEFPIIRVVVLKRDASRKLGETRNVSVREARGQYCLLHLDCDDVYDEHIQSWVGVYHQIEAVTGDGILLAGHHINMARRDVLLKEGPYLNIFRAEDRYMWARFAAREKLWLLDHEDFVVRLPKTSWERFYRGVVHTVDHIITDFRGGTPLLEYIRIEGRKAKGRSAILILFRLAVLPFTWVVAKLRGPLPRTDETKDHEDLRAYRNAHRATFECLVRAHGGQPDWSSVPARSRGIFDITPTQERIEIQIPLLRKYSETRV